ncbi:MAG TPA: MFS transporter [Kineosporiaceae bacterium]|nr:MFS transporter [Kineosporiaceae bacterium]
MTQTTAVHPVPVHRSRWFVLVAFALLVACTQVLWLSFAPISNQAHQALGVSDGAVGDLAVINPLMYVLLAIPIGRWTDRRFAIVLGAGAICTAGGAALRLVDPTNYGWVFAGQFVLSIGQPLVLNSTTKIAARYFRPTERTAAISVASAAQFVGILAAAMSGEALFNAGGLQLVLLVHAAVSVVAGVAVLLAVRVPASYAADAGATPPLGWLRRDPLMWRLGALLFVGVGVFNAVATWLDKIMSDLGHRDVGGNLIAVMTVAGIVGAAVLPGAAAGRDRRRQLLTVVTLSTVVVFLAVALLHNVYVVGVLLAVEGFFLLAGLPVALDWSELEAGPSRAGTATGFLLLAGNLGGVVLVLVVQAVIGNPYLALVAMSVMAVPGVLVALRLPDHARSHLEDDGPVQEASPA